MACAKTPCQGEAAVADTTKETQDQVAVLRAKLAKLERDSRYFPVPGVDARAYSSIQDAVDALHTTGGVVDCRGLTGTRTIYSTVSIGNQSPTTSGYPVVLLMNPATIYQPGAVDTDMFSIGNRGQLLNVTINTTNLAYTGNAIKFTGYYGDGQDTCLDNALIIGTRSAAAGGKAILIDVASPSVAAFINLSNIRIFGFKYGIYLNTDDSFINSNVFSNIEISKSLYGIVFDGSGTFSSNLFNTVQFQSAVTTDDGYASTKGFVVGGSHNQFSGCCIWDMAVSSQTALEFSSSSEGNVFSGRVIGKVVDAGTDNSLFEPRANFGVRTTRPTSLWTVNGTGRFTDLDATDTATAPTVNVRGVNQIINPSFELGSWYDWAGWTADKGFLGTGSANSRTGDIRCEAAGDGTNQTLVYQTVPVDASTTYYASCWLKATSAGGSAGMYVVWRDSGGSTISTDNVFVSPTGSYQQATDVLTSPATAVAALVALTIRDTIDGPTVYFDDVEFYKGTGDLVAGLAGNARVEIDEAGIRRYSDATTTTLDVNDTGTRVSNFLGVGAPVLATILSGAITVAGSHYKVAVESGTADDLDSIAGGEIGDILRLTAAENGKAVTVKDNKSTLFLASDCVLNSIVDSIVLIRTSATVWAELARSNNL